MSRSQRFMCRCRSSACQKRTTLKRHPDDYKIPRKCAECNGPLRLDKAAMKRRREKVTCHCDAYWFMHEQGYGACKYPKHVKNKYQQRGIR